MMDNLRKGLITVADCCYMCKKSWETTDHLLPPFDVAKELWDMILCLLGEQWSCPDDLVDLSTC